MDLSGGGVSNLTYDPKQLQFVYAGPGHVKITGGSETSALVYAPNASAEMKGASTHYFGAVVANRITSTGGFNLNYDRRLQQTMLGAGKWTLSAFTWATF